MINTPTRTMHLAFLLTLTLILGLFFTGTPSAGAAAPTGPMVSAIKVVAGHSVLSLTLDKPMPAGEAKTVERRLRGDLQATSGMFATASVGRHYVLHNGDQLLPL